MTTARADEGTIRCFPRVARSPRAESRGVPAARALLATALAVALCTTTAAEAAFVRYVVTAVDVAHEGKELTVYTVAARFDGAADTVLLAHQLKSADPAMLKGFWHKDSATLCDTHSTLVASHTLLIDSASLTSQLVTAAARSWPTGWISRVSLSGCCADGIVIAMVLVFTFSSSEAIPSRPRHDRAASASCPTDPYDSPLLSLIRLTLSE